MVSRNLLTLLGDIFGIDSRFFLKNQFFLSLSTIANISIGFGLSILFARYVDKTTFGQYSLITYFVSTLGFTGLYGLRSILPFVITKKREGFYPQALKYSFVSSLVGSIFLIAAAIYYFQPDKPNLTGVLVLTAALFPFLNSFVFYPSVLTGKNRFAAQSMYLIIKAVIPNAVLAVVILIAPQTFWLILFSFTTQVAIDLILTRQTLKLLKNKTTSPKDLAYGLKLSIIWLFPMAIVHLDKILLAKLLGFEGVAVYTFAILIPQQITNFLKNFQPLAVFKISLLSERRVELDLPKKTFALMLFIVPFVVFYIIAAPAIFNLFYPAYKESVFYSQLYSLGILFFPTTILTQSFHHLRRITSSFKFSLTTSIMRVIVVLVFVPKFGLTGAALSFVICSLIEFIIALTLVKKPQIVAGSVAQSDLVD